jgi:hypothetical protein
MMISSDIPISTRSEAVLIPLPRDSDATPMEPGCQSPCGMLAIHQIMDGENLERRISTTKQNVGSLHSEVGVQC